MKIDGRELAEQLYQDLEKRVGELQEKNLTPHLVVILVGNNPASEAYVLQKQRAGERIGAKVTILNYPEDINTEILEEKIKLLNEDPYVHGILIQRPLPAHLDSNKLSLLTKPQKDVDGFNPDSAFTLPLPLAIVYILKQIYRIIQDGVTSGEGFPSSARNEVRTSDGRGARQDPLKNLYINAKKRNSHCKINQF
jgi:5,10-methylene-tetrahydrofolate dehydrogenase/methenyl tetrahydrofolate cyclohydrolase